MQDKINTAEQNLDQEIGARVASLRKQRGITQAQMREALGVSQAQVSYLESGKTPWSAVYMARAAEVLGVSRQMIFGHVDDVVVGLALEPGETDLVKLIRKGDELGSVRALVAELTRRKASTPRS